MKGFWLLPLVEVKYPANGPMFQINGSSWYFVKVTGIRSLIPTGMACLMPDSFSLHTTHCRGGTTRPYARMAVPARLPLSRLVDPAPSVNAGCVCRPRPKTSQRHRFARAPPLRCNIRCFSHLRGVFSEPSGPETAGARRAGNHYPRLRFGFAGSSRVARHPASENPQVKAVPFSGLLERCHQNRTVNGDTRYGRPPGGPSRQKRARIRSRVSFGPRR